MPEVQSEFGVIYFVDDNPKFLQMLDLSIQSLKRFHPDWPVEVIRCPSFPVPLWKKLYRALSFWKWQRRRERAHQDARVIGAKAEAMLKTPFRTTLYLDVDTIILKPLDALRRQAEQCDVLATQLSWKHFDGLEDWQPKRFPMFMAGLCFYSDRFVETYRSYVERLGPIAWRLPCMDQFIFSLACEMEGENLDIQLAPTLQFDVINAAQHFGRDDYPRLGEFVDLRTELLEPFHIFHYNEYKPHYLRQIAEVWGLVAS